VASLTKLREPNFTQLTYRFRHCTDKQSSMNQFHHLSSPVSYRCYITRNQHAYRLFWRAPCFR
jgi:hypothetical protein